jgi:hypothetical protein
MSESQVVVVCLTSGLFAVVSWSIPAWSAALAGRTVGLSGSVVVGASMGSLRAVMAHGLVTAIRGRSQIMGSERTKVRKVS